jgi:hypothetical protein
MSRLVRLNDTHPTPDGVPRLTKEQAVIITAFTGIMCCDMQDLHEYAKRKLGITDDLGSMGIVMIADRLKHVARKDFMALLPEG